MKTEELFNVIGEIDDDMITKAKSTVSDTLSGQIIRRSWKPFAALAACLAVVIIGAAVIIGVNTHKNAIKSVDSGSNSGNSEIKAAEYPESAKYQYTGDFSELTPASYGIVDRMVFGYFDDLAKSSSLIVVGTFVDDARQDVPLTGKITWDSRSASLLPGASYNKLRVDRVFKGDVEAGSQIVIRGNYYVNEGELAYVYGAASTPMIKGEQWVYFLSKTDPKNGDYYVSLGCNDGRFFVPGNENTFVLKELEEYLVGDNMAYEDVKIMLGEPGGVERLGTKSWLKDTGEFVLPEFPAETFIKTNGSIYIKGTGQVIVQAPGIVDVYFADLDGDGRREIVCSYWNGASGFSANYIAAYNAANSRSYVLKHPLSSETQLLSYDLEVRNGVLYAVEYNLGQSEEFASKPLTLDLMNVVDINSNQITYDGKTYNIANTLTTKDGVTFTIGLTKPEYKAGEYVEVLGIVENNSNKEIGMYTPGINAPFNHEISVVIKQGDVRLEYDDPYLMDCAVGSTILKPGERFCHAFLFDTREERIDDKDTVIPLCKPVGTYRGYACITLMSDPYDTDPNGDSKNYDLDFEVNVVQRDALQNKEFTMDEFGGLKFRYNKYSLWVNDGQTDLNLFNGSPIENLYLIDLNGDGKREICANVRSYAKGYAHIAAYDYANRKLYDLSDPGYYDYRMRIDTNIDGSYIPEAYKYKHNTTEQAAMPETLTLDIMKEVKKLSDNIRTSATGASEITKLGETFTMEEFPEKTFYFEERMLKYTDKNGTDKELFASKIENIYLYDLNGDGRREIIIKGLVDVFNGNTSTTEPDAAKIISAIDLENENGINLYPYSKECSLAIVNNALHFVLNGEREPNPLTFEHFLELAKSPNM